MYNFCLALPLPIIYIHLNFKAEELQLRTTLNSLKVPTAYVLPKDLNSRKKRISIEWQTIKVAKSPAFCGRLTHFASTSRSPPHWQLSHT